MFGMRTTRPVFGRDVRPLHMDAGDRRARGGRNHARVTGEVVERRGYQRRQATSHARGAQRIERHGQSVRVQVRRVEIDAAEAIDLEIDQARKRYSHVRMSPRAAALSSDADSRSRYSVVLSCVRRIDAGAIGEMSPSTHALTASAFRASGTMQMISRALRICRTDMEIARFGTSATDRN